MAADLEDAKKGLLNFVVTELSKPATNHVYNFMKYEMGASRLHILASLLAAKDSPEHFEENAARPDKRSLNYETLTTCKDADFKMHFRMSRSTIQSLTRIVGKRLTVSPEAVHPLVPVEKKVLLTVWLMGNSQSYMAAAKLFEVSKGTVYRIFHHICSELTILAEKYIQWPDPNECDEISVSFENKYGFPGVIGVIGACHVEIREPESQEEALRFKNEQTGQYTVILQAVCDDRLRFRDVCAGFPGQTSKLRVLVGSPLYTRLSSHTDPLIEPHKHILGSSDYPQLSTLLTPYSSSACGFPLTKQEVKFNMLHHTATSVVEQAFEVLKRRFQRLRFIDVSRTELASKVVVAACVLHNFALMHGDSFTDECDKSKGK